MQITAINKATGEVIELDANTPEEIVAAWRIAQEYSKAADALKEQLKKLVPEMVGDRGTSDPIDGFMFRISPIQRMSYDKSVLREVIKDQDLLDTFLTPDKPVIDKYLKENLEVIGDVSTRLRTTMIAVGKPYQVIKLEKLA